ncbi:hypothetical protein [Streptomyces sp. MMG1533]|uniref:hypothetical protein n=1 Tax=Streptomyces sp. MMG1533 TaxID=1415546 RepID=UPI0006AE6C83|nr:hypothetical protein [Streptomyces sp. MMG1533]
MALVAACTVVGLTISTTGPAHAATFWDTESWTDPSDKDPGGVEAGSGLWRSDGSGEYWVFFDPYGEKLSVKDGYADGHAARARVVVTDAQGHTQDEDTFYVGTADGLKEYNLGTPDGSGDIAEGLNVTVYVCINETTTCSPSTFGKA